ncbi:sensor domain-containing diguanylate cyclase [Thermotoga profunda]|uniref:sensor domain-containing diguanylate cyclase n=1 Tax=Thermotoga profunda TaxID=1508420 RepID=UPI0005975052|nr:sensor domain-containing diguanylate cyclase [Thermotoga profunda]
MEDILIWFCRRNIIPCAIFKDGTGYEVNPLFKNFLTITDTNTKEKIKLLVEESRSKPTATLNFLMDKCGIWQTLTAFSIQQKNSIYTILLLEPNPNLVEHAATFFQAMPISPVMIVNKKVEILFCNKPEFDRFEQMHPQQWENIKKMIQKASKNNSIVQDDIIINNELYKIIVIPEYDDFLVVFKDITSQRLAEERYKQLRLFGLHFSLVEKIMNVLSEEKTDLRKIGRIIYEETRKVVPIDTFYLALVDGEFVVIEYGINQGKEITGLKIKRGYTGLSNYVIDKGEFTYIPNTKTVRLDPYKPKAIVPGETNKIWSYVGIPLKLGSKIVGAISFQKLGSRAFTESHLALFELIGREIAVAMKMKSLFDELETQRLRYKEIAMKDSLTGCYTRYYFMEYFERFQGIIERKGGQICFVMIDVNNFKHINDSYGHVIGDAVLREVGKSLLKSVRKMDLVVRYGGDEFLLMLPYVDVDKGNQIAERISRKIQNLKITGFDERLSVSFGVSIFDGSRTLEEVLKIADKNMYKMKKGERP